MAKAFGRVKVNATTLATQGWTINDGVDARVIGHDGQTHHDALIIAQNTITVNISGIPLKQAYDLFDFSPLAVTTLELYGIDLGSDGTIQSTGDKFSLSSASGVGMIDSFSVAQNGVWLANATIYIVSDDGSTDPLARGAAQAVPAVAAPTHYTMGSLTANTAGETGLKSVNGTINANVVHQATDGNVYPTIIAVNQLEATVGVSLENPKDARDVVTSIGAGIASTTTIGMPDVDSDGVIGGGTALTLTMANGHIVPAGSTGQNPQTVTHDLTFRVVSSATATGLSIA